MIIQLADHEFGKPSSVDILLDVDVFVNVLRHGRWIGHPGSPVALQTKFGWVLAGNTDPAVTSNLAIVTHLTSVMTGEELIKKFRELEEVPMNELNPTPEEKSVMQHFTIHHSRRTICGSLAKKGQCQAFG